MSTTGKPSVEDLTGRVALITGGGTGIGRQHALRLAAAGASVVVNDIEPPAGRNAPAAEVVAEIVADGGRATAIHADVASWSGAESLIAGSVAAFGHLDVVVNNAGILRDGLLVSMTEAEWDDVVRVHLKGHAAISHHAAVYWREQAKQGNPRRASLINTASTSGLFGNPGQANYAAAKAGIIGLTLTASMELERYGVRANVIVPAARTAMTEGVPALRELMKAPEDPDAFDGWHPRHVSSYVAWLASSECPLNGSVVFVSGHAIRPVEGFYRTPGLAADGREITVSEMSTQIPKLVEELVPRK